MLLLALLAMSSSDEDEAGAIKRAQAAAMNASASAAAPRRAGSGPVQAPGPNAELLGALPADMLASVSSGPRKTCVKAKLLEKCVHCTNRPRDREACAYKTGEWAPGAGRGRNVTAEQQGLGDELGSAGSSTEPEGQNGGTRDRRPPERLDPGEFWLRELPDTAARRLNSTGGRDWLKAQQIWRCKWLSLSKGSSPSC